MSFVKYIFSHVFICNQYFVSYGFIEINRFVELRNKMMRFAIELATMAQRDRFVENPVEMVNRCSLSGIYKQNVFTKIISYFIID